MTPEGWAKKCTVARRAGGCAKSEEVHDIVFDCVNGAWGSGSPRMKL
jgi:hypothetical protein